ncbi:DNA-binding protein [bioreactor metagenome]|uniref:DNA-binding protein n=1 Tax=bioreactor metagenome TaxID=1076179 RepID=A0A644XRA7_9ZZZZ
MDKENTKQNTQPNNPLHGVKLITMLEELVAHYGWERLAEKININCFKKDPSIKSSLTFLRKTPWARDEVERLYIFFERKRQLKQAKARSKPDSY